MIMERLDYFDIMPAGMQAYMSSHGRHFSKAMLDWAVGMMTDRNGNKRKPIDRKKFDSMMESYGITLDRTEGYYDGIYVWSMAMSDYFGSSIKDEQHIAMFVKDYIDDIDGNPTRAFDEFMINCTAKGIDVPWQDMI